MSESLKILNNIRTLRAQARETSLETLEEMLEKLEVVVNERREEFSLEKAAEEERVQKLQKYREMLEEAGIFQHGCRDNGRGCCGTTGLESCVVFPYIRAGCTGPVADKTSFSLPTFGF